MSIIPESIAVENPLVHDLHVYVLEMADNPTQ
jgi:hypothetical protein